MGKQIHLEKIKDLFEKSHVVDFSSIKRIVGVKTEKSNYAKLLVSNLIKKEKIKKLSKGFYTKHNEISFAVFAFKPAYLGLQSALSFYGLWEQETIPVILTTKKVRRGIRKVFGSNILVRNINKKYFFGFEFLKEASFYLPYSNIEKTFIDFVIFNEKIDNSTLKKIKEKINLSKLKEYLKIYPENLRKKIERKINSLKF